MEKPKNRMSAFLLCVVFGPFGLFYISKKGGIILSAMMALTLIAGWLAIGMQVASHPLSADDIQLLMSGQFPSDQSELTTILYIELAVIVVEWLASIVWALVTPTPKVRP